MTLDELYEAFEKAESLPLNKEASDLDGFIKLKELGWKARGRDLLAAAEHDQVWLDVDLEWLANVASVNDVNFLSQCFLFIEDDTLSMFV